MVEGDFIQIKGNAVPQSSDIVFIIEAKECNNFSLRRKNMPSIVSTIAKELQDVGIINNRFADFIIFFKVLAKMLMICLNNYLTFLAPDLQWWFLEETMYLTSLIS